ncbi:MAG: hypothetical protein RM368_26365 [Nostoc sp. DedSLP03]|uniref:nucleotide-binding protein n=1 Tax=Nostoc sp. DedSLP03 TaxID=3075400 RepID=UPI002AD1D1D4|nr:hypothetical protein [Nostoc sp. DedSLP03]MDZ7968433.1 hypothetical protein [Nostoc sp. DedSLP03]
MTDSIELMNNDSEDKANEQSIEQPTKKRLVIVTGDKGGVGKSTFARGLVQTYLDKGQRFIGFDADSSNSQLLRFYGRHCHIEPLDIFKTGNIDQFFDEMKTKANPKVGGDGEIIQPESLFLLELPPQSRRILRKFVEEMTFLETAEKHYNIRVTMVVVISRVIDSINQLIDLHSFCGNQVDYIVVKNLFFGEPDEFTRYKNSPEVQKIKKQLESQKSPFSDMTMPELIERSYDYLDENSMTFRQGMEQTDLPSVKGRVTSWLRTFKEEIEAVKESLGLNNVELS